MRRITPFILPGFLILFLSILTILYSFLTGSLPDYTGKIISEDIQAPVTVYFDKMGIPQIQAEVDEDLWFVLGWMHAQERLFQMELTRRVSCGRLAAMLGKDVLSIDRLQRTIGHRRMALGALQNLDQDTQRKLLSYTSGINAWVDYSTALPFEFYLLGIKYEDWTALDCLTVFSFQTWYSDYLQNNDALYISIEEQFGRDKAIDLQADYPQWAPTTVFQFPTGNKLLPDIFVPASSGIAGASNGWVIAPQRSASGFAILASDPHLDIYRLPQFWYAVGLRCLDTEINAFGVTTPGLPFMAYGHNGQAAWAFTAGGVDVTDFYSEQLHPQDKSVYKTPEGWEHFEKINEIIHISGADTVEKLVIRKTRHGPVVTPDDSLNFVTSFRWAGFDISLSEAIRNGFKLLKVADFDTFRSLITHFAALNANWLYADKSGTIGYQLGTPVPIRDFRNSQLLLPGWESQYDWRGYYDLEKTPHAENPERGWLASCNNKPAGDNLDYDLPGNFAADRILRISDLLDSKGTFSAKDMQKFQYDYVSEYMLRWKDSAANVLAQMTMPELTQELVNWTGDFSGQGQAGAVMNHWLYYLKKLTFEDELLSRKSEFENPHMFRDIVLENVFFNGPDHWFDDIRTNNTVESKESISRRAMQLACAEVDGKSWIDLQKLEIEHPFAQNAVIDFILNLSRGPFARGGTNSTLNATTSAKDSLGGFKVLIGPSMRFIVDFADINKTSVVFPAGQSGHPLSAHFFDFYDLWSTENVWIVPFENTEIAEQSASRLVFEPGRN